MPPGHYARDGHRPTVCARRRGAGLSSPGRGYAAMTPPCLNPGRPSSPAKGSPVPHFNPIGKIKDVAVGTILHPRKTAGSVVGTARDTVGLGRDVVGQVGSRLLGRQAPPSAPPVQTSEPTSPTT